jgi:hypothetical protein
MRLSCSDIGSVEHAGLGQERVGKPHSVEGCFI